MRIVTLLSDFGTRDSYVGQMKGVILSLCPDCQVVDITHEVERHDILMGAFLLETTVGHFPKGTVHVAIIDPGVGSKRLPLAITCRQSILVGPDNGVLARAARKLGMASAYKIQRSGLRAGPVSPTFHGRDVFAVAAARLAGGAHPKDLGPRVQRLVKLDLPSVTVKEGQLNCCVLHVDRFGNIITNAENRYLASLGLKRRRRVKVTCKKGVFEGSIVDAYHDVGHRGLAIIPGSQGYVEVALREEDAALLLHVRQKDWLEIRSAS